MILLSHSSYSQYPITKKIKGDSVVIMKVSQADTINMLYRNYNDTIDGLRLSMLKEKTKFYDTIVKKIHTQTDSSFYWKGKTYEYEADSRQREKIIKQIDTVAYVHLLLLTILLIIKP